MMLASRAIAEAGTAASTAMPFLYQTKTLSSWAWTGAKPLSRGRYRSAVLRRHLSRTIRAQNTDERTTTENPGPDTPASSCGPAITPDALDIPSLSEGPSIRRVRIDTGIGPRYNRADFPVPDNPEPDQGFKIKRSVYHRPSGLKSSPSTGITLPAKPRYASLSRRSVANQFDADNSPIEFDEELEDEDIFQGGSDDIQDLTMKPESPNSTITETERAAFQKIFSDIFQRSQRSGSPGIGSDGFNDAYSASGRAEQHDEGPSFAVPSTMSDKPVLENQREARLKLENIFATAMKASVLSREQMEAAIKRYPPPLRAAAAKAMGYVAEEDEAAAGETTRRLLDTEQLETLREPERARVEALMISAKTDFELMEIMEKEVFSLIAKLGLADAPNSGVKPSQEDSPTKAKRVKGWKKAELRAKREQNQALAPKQTDELSEEVREEPTEESEVESTIPAVPKGPLDGVSPLALYGPLYPSYLLFGLRLLDRSFAKPSPLALSILPKIKSLGFISHVLGASTQLYNELLRIYRYRYDDFRGMLDLLSEMEDAALDFDEDTYKIVRDIVKLQTSILRGEKGTALFALWRMPEFERHRFPKWHAKIREAVREKERQPRI
ncbi:hypothetical protein LZ554_006437 [Drepanopeziza brunnea f. sp. 'monogermtubi']|nr:hypothetical protein LZ554_006437 [Drepanopeziza brunnea f. sp. 'monogermtubi']